MTPAIAALREARDARNEHEELMALNQRDPGALDDMALIDACLRSDIKAREAIKKADTILALLESREAAARAVVWAYDEWVRQSRGGLYPNLGTDAHADVVLRATGEGPRQWTRLALLAHFGLEE